MAHQNALREYLQDALIKGRLRNPSYSLRALAVRAGLSPSALSEILSGKRKVSIERTKKILNKMGTDPGTTQSILKSFGENSLGPPNQTLSIDQFYLIADWYHFAILSLAETETFKSSPEWIADRLNVSVPTVVKAIDRLERLGALQRNSKGALKPTNTQLSSPDEVTHRGLQQQHLEILDKCRESLSADSIDERDFLGVTMTLDPDDLPLAKKLLRRFVGKFCNQLEKGRKKEVYRLNLQFIPLTKKHRSS